MSERLHKILARHGLGSRREIERWIAEGRITVNLEKAAIGATFRPGDRVAIDGKEVTARLNIEVAPDVIAFHKAQGQPISQTVRHAAVDSAEGAAPLPRDSMEPVMDRLPLVRGSRWVPINPMHAGDSGLLLLTNDGTLGFALTRRKRWISTAYLVRVLSPDESSDALRVAPEVPPIVTYDSDEGSVTIEFTSVQPTGGEGSNLWYRVEMARADHRAAVRALFETRNLKVSRMTQVAFGPIELPRDLPRGRQRSLSADQRAALYELAQIPEPAQPKPKREQIKPSKRIAPDRRRKPKPRTASKSESGSARKKSRSKPLRRR